MISHVTLGSDDLRRAVAFYDPVMATLGLVKVLDVPGATAYAQSEDAKPWLYILRPFDGGPARSASRTCSCCWPDGVEGLTPAGKTIPVRSAFVLARPVRPAG